MLNIISVITLILLILVAGAATDKASSIIVYGKIFMPFRNFIAKRAFPDDTPSHSTIKFFIWKIWSILNAMMTCTECTGMWVSMLTVYVSDVLDTVAISNHKFFDFAIKVGAVAYCATYCEFLRVGRVVAIDLDLKHKHEANVVCSRHSTNSLKETESD